MYMYMVVIKNKFVAIQDDFLELFWEVFGDLGDIIRGLQGCQNFVENSSKCQASPGRAQVDWRHPGGGNWSVQGLSRKP